MASDSSFQFLDFLLLRCQRLALRGGGGASAFLLELVNPAAQRGLDHPERSAGFGMARVLIKQEACGLAFDSAEKERRCFVIKHLQLASILA
jgi:hypothetical protein